jgi:hypothetical protein
MLIYPQQQVNERSTLLADVGELKLATEQRSAADAVKPESAEADRVVADSNSVTAVESQSGGTEQQQSEQVSAEDLVVETPASLLEEAPATARCAMLGYVDTRSAAEEISVRLRALGFKPELQSESRNEQAGYWVLIPQQSSRREAVKIAKKLEQSGVSDLWRFTSGKLVHAISLGLFRDEIRAGDRKREIDALGFDSVIQPRYREKTNYWLKYQKDDGVVISDKEWSGLVRDFPELLRKEIACQ